MAPYLLEIFVVVVGLVMLTVDAFAGRGSRGKVAIIGLVGIGLAFVALLFFVCCPKPDLNYWGVYHFDKWAAFFKGIALLTTAAVLIMGLEFAPVMKRYTSQNEENAGLGEFYALPVLACAGLMWMASSRDLITIFVSLEVVTMAFYILVTYMRRNVGSLEAGVKYLILGALSTGFLVYGITWTFGVTGEFGLDKIGAALASGEVAATPAVFAFGLLMVGLAFKIAAFPFQIWVPDVYQGAPMPVTAFLSVGSKAAGFIVLLRIAEPFLTSGLVGAPVVMLLAVITCATLIYGNLAAIPQTNVKRLLAYSSISHAGFLLMALPAMAHGTELAGLDPKTAISFYLAAYLLMTLLCFLVMTAVRVATDGEDLGALRGLAKRSPFLAFAMLVGLASLAGVPLTVGFVGKFFLFNIAVQDAMASGLWIVVAVGIIGAAAGFYYYFKIIRSMYWESPEEGNDGAVAVGLLSRTAIVVLLVSVFLFGVLWKPILAML